MLPQLRLYARHNLLRNRFTSLCQDAGLKVEIEKSPEGFQARPADVLVHGLECGSPVAVDFSVVHTLQQSRPLADMHPGKLAAKVKKQKQWENRPLCQRVGWECRPFVVEAVGAYGSGARGLMHSLAKQYALKLGVTRKEAGLACSAALGTSVVRAVCRQLERGFPAPGSTTPHPRTNEMACF